MELLPRDQWKRPSDKIVDQELLSRNENADVEEAESITSERERRALIDEAKRAHKATGDDARIQPTAKVVGIVKRNWRS